MSSRSSSHFRSSQRRKFLVSERYYVGIEVITEDALCIALAARLRTSVRVHSPAKVRMRTRTRRCGYRHHNSTTAWSYLPSVPEHPAKHILPNLLSKLDLNLTATFHVIPNIKSRPPISLCIITLHNTQPPSPPPHRHEPNSSPHQPHPSPSPPSPLAS